MGRRHKRRRRTFRAARRNFSATAAEVLGDSGGRQFLIIETVNSAADAADGVASRLVRDTLAKGEVMHGQNGTAPPATAPAATAATATKLPRVGQGTGRIVLNRAGERKLEDWLSSQWDRIEQDKATKDAVAAEATRALGFNVSRGNVVGAARTIEKTWPAMPRKGGLNNKEWRRAVVLQIAAIRAKVGAPELPEFAVLLARALKADPDTSLPTPAVTTPATPAAPATNPPR